MLKNYLIVTFRNLFRNIFYVLINIIGLGLALAICIVAYLNHTYDADFDAWHVNKIHIYKIEFTHLIQARSQPYGITPITLGPTIENKISGIEKIVRVNRSYSPMKVGENNFNKRIAYADPDFFDVFTFHLISGNKESFRDKNTIFINERLAEIYFGDVDPVGKIISIFNDNGEEFSFIVGGVMKNLPLNSSFIFEAVTQIDNFIEMWDLDEFDWSAWTAGTFIYINNPEQTETITELLQQFVPIQNEARENFKIEQFYLVPFTDMAHHGWDIWAHWFRQSFHPAAVTAPPIMAIFILLIACFNFTNTSIAFSSKRLKEIGVRKVTGGLRKQIILQFMSENLFLSFFALIFAVFFANFLVPAYSSMWEYMDLSFSLSKDPELWIFLFLLLVVTALVAGAYPSFYISRFNPVNIFQDKLSIGGRNVLSRILITLQFAISVLALVSGIMFTQNANYQNNIYLGYDKDHIIAIPVSNTSYFEPYKNTIKSNPKIESVGESEEHIGWSMFSRPVNYNDIKLEVDMFDIGHGYFNTMGLRLIEGREFEPHLEKTDANGSIIVNQKFIEDFGISDPIGKTVKMNDTVPLYIIGVMENFFRNGVWTKIEPTVFRLANKERLRMLTTRASPENLQDVYQYLEEEWKKMVPNYPFEGFYQEERMEEAKNINKSIKTVYVFLAVMALLLSAIGLHTLVSLSIIRRTKEIGIRKVLGASVQRIVRLLNNEFLLILIIASIIGTIGGYYSSIILMESIWDYFTDVTAITFIIPILLIFIISAITVGGKVIEAALRNPAESLRYE